MPPNDLLAKLEKLCGGSIQLSAILGVAVCSTSRQRHKGFKSEESGGQMLYEDCDYESQIHLGYVDKIRVNRFILEHVGTSSLSSVWPLCLAPR